jgi:hypothetical protein
VQQKQSGHYPLQMSPSPGTGEMGTSHGWVGLVHLARV